MDNERIGTIETVMVDNNTPVCGTVYHVRDNGWACVETDTGRVASGPSTHEWACMSQEDRNTAIYGHSTPKSED